MSLFCKWEAVLWSNIHTSKISLKKYDYTLPSSGWSSKLQIHLQKELISFSITQIENLVMSLPRLCYVVFMTSKQIQNYSPSPSLSLSSTGEEQEAECIVLELAGALM